MRSEFIEFIKILEGFKSQVYRCPAGYPTIGYGHVLKVHENFSEGISFQEAEVLLRKDLKKAQQSMSRLVRVPLTFYQREALTSFVFNLGPMAFQRSTLRAKINREYHQDVPKELRRWVFYGPHKLPGLMKRRALEANWYQGIEFYQKGDHHVYQAY